MLFLGLHEAVSHIPHSIEQCDSVSECVNRCNVCEVDKDAFNTITNVLFQ